MIVVVNFITLPTNFSTDGIDNRYAKNDAPKLLIIKNIPTTDAVRRASTRHPQVTGIRHKKSTILKLDYYFQ
jgi:hypothetical protein